MNFPQDITQIRADMLYDLRRKFSGPADEDYKRLTKWLVTRTGHEFTRNPDGSEYTRAQWEAVMRNSITHLNSELFLGLSDDAIEIMTLCYTMLTQTPRFGGDPIIGQKEGENTGVHSLHTVLQGLVVYQKALEKNPALGTDIQIFRNFQLTAIMLMVHDFGELLGEAGSLAQAAEAGNLSVKDKEKFERNVFNLGVRLAAKVVTENLPKSEFYDRMDKVKSLMKVQNSGTHRSDDELADELSGLMTPDDLSPRGAEVFNFLLEAWECVEAPDKSATPFIGHVAAVCERVQGGRHINRLGRSCSPVFNAAGGTDMVPTSTFLPGYRIMMNAGYTESRLASLVAATKHSLDRELMVTKEVVARAYDTCVGFMTTSKAFFRDPAIPETRLHKDGTAYTAAETAQRLREIDAADQIARYEADAVKGLATDEFNAAAIPTGWTAINREQIFNLYQGAIHKGYLPGFVDVGGKKTGEILLLHLPKALTGVQDMPEARKAQVASVVKEMIAQKIGGPK